MTTLRAMARRSVLLSWFIMLILIGGHWGILQLAAWTNMALHSADSTSFTTAFISAVDGQHPCKLCQAIDKVTNNEQPNPAVLFLFKKFSHSDAVFITTTIKIHKPTIVDHLGEELQTKPNSFLGDNLLRPPIVAI